MKFHFTVFLVAFSVVCLVVVLLVVFFFASALSVLFISLTLPPLPLFADLLPPLSSTPELFTAFVLADFFVNLFSPSFSLADFLVDLFTPSFSPLALVGREVCDLPLGVGLLECAAEVLVGLRSVSVSSDSECLCLVFGLEVTTFVECFDLSLVVDFPVVVDFFVVGDGRFSGFSDSSE